MPTLKLTGGSSQNPQTLDLSQYLVLTDDGGADPYDPQFTNRVFARSLLKEGATLPYVQLVEKQQTWPLLLSAVEQAHLTNLVLDPSFEYDALGAAPAAWAPFTVGSTFAVQNGWAQSGSQSLRYTMTSATGAETAGVETLSGTNGMPVVGGESYIATVTVNVLTNTAGGSTSAARINWYTSAGALISSSPIGPSGSGDLPSTPGVYTFSGELSAPSNAALANLVVAAKFSSSGQELDCYVDAAMLSPGASGAYVDGDSTGYHWTGEPGDSASTWTSGTTQLQNLITALNQVLNTPGSVVSWQDDGASQPTYFDLIVGEFQVEYRYREAQVHYTRGKLLLFNQPLGHTAGPRPYAAASGVGPLLMISPYASGGQSTLVASNAGFGASPGMSANGASGGVSYWGSPSLAGDAAALLQVSYVGPLPVGATNTGLVPTVAVSLLPDALYAPLITAPEIGFANLTGATSRLAAQTSVASSYLELAGSGASTSVQDIYSFGPLPEADVGLEPTLAWAGQHRLFAIARASATGGPISATLQPQANALTRSQPAVPIPAGLDWQPYDLGTFSLRPSEFPQQQVQVAAGLTFGGASAALDVAALVMLPDSTTWFFNPAQIIPSQYGYPPSLASGWGAAAAPYTNTLLLDDVLADQFIYSGQSQSFAPSPLGSVPSSSRITQFSRGLVPRPDPKAGLPILAILGLGQAGDAAVPASLSVPALAAGPNSPSVGSDVSGIGDIAWSNPGNVTTLDGDAATAALSAGNGSHFLVATGYGFSIPAGAVIQGIAVQVVRQSGSEKAMVDAAARLVKAGAIQSTDRSMSIDWPASYAGATYGGPTDLWGGNWLPADINNAGFGFAIAASAPAALTASVDYVSITVYYGFGVQPSFQGASQPNPQNLRTYAQVNVLERVRYILP